MSLENAFELVGQNHNKPFITLRNRSITFSKNAIEDLKYTPYVHMYIDRKGHRAAFQPCEKDEAAITFYVPPKEGRSVLVRISDRQKAKILMDIAGVEDCGKGIRYYGEYIKEENAFIISLKDD